MKSSEIREKYLNFFEKKGHVRIDPAPLVLEDDSTTLFTSAGMQPLVPYLVGEPHPSGSKRLVNSQPSIRLGDIEEVGDNRHNTFFEMLGNWSLGDYFKDEQLNWIYEFFTSELGIDKKKLWVTVFEGSKEVPRDSASFEIWKKIGLPENRIVFLDAKRNWWSMTGAPEEMSIGHIGGPDSEIFYDFGEGLKIHEKSQFKDDECGPGCDCGRFLEIGNSVFIQYKKTGNNKLEELSQRNVDFGGGLERITAAVNKNPDIFSTDLFISAINKIREKFEIHEQYGSNPTIDESLRVIADHLRASYILISSGITPSNKAQGYVLRRLIRRSVMHSYFINKSGKLELPALDFTNCGIPTHFLGLSEIDTVIKNESEKFYTAFSRGMKKLRDETAKYGKVSVDFAFDLYQSEGFPLEITSSILEKEGSPFSDAEKEKIDDKLRGHKDRSRSTSAGIFKGGLADHSPEVVKLHTATHLLLASLRKILGEHVVQKGQNITKERSRFDFSNSEKLTLEQIKKIEDLVNSVIDKRLPVKFEVMKKDDALETGAIHGFNEKYADTVKVYYAGDDLGSAFSKEFCGGPHVANTSEIGHVKITKQEKVGAGTIRLYTKLE